MKGTLLALVAVTACLTVIACQEQKKARVTDNCASGTCPIGGGSGATFNVDLRPGENATDSNGSGTAWFCFSQDGTSAQYRLSAQNMCSNVTEAHIHLGKPGTEGPPVVTLFSGSPKQAKGEISSGTFTKSDLMGPLSGKEICDLIREIRNNNAYVNVHTEKYPRGEIRGQMVWPNGGKNLQE